MSILIKINKQDWAKKIQNLYFSWPLLIMFEKHPPLLKKASNSCSSFFVEAQQSRTHTPRRPSTLNQPGGGVILTPFSLTRSASCKRVGLFEKPVWFTNNMSSVFLYYIEEECGNHSLPLREGALGSAELVDLFSVKQGIWSFVYVLPETPDFVYIWKTQFGCEPSSSWR